MNRPPTHPATLCDDRYELLEVLGKGGMAYVYRAIDHKLGVERAIKVLTIDEDTERPGLRKRLRSEARAMAQLEHPNVLRVYDIGDDGSLDFIVMDFAPGGSLKERQENLGVIPVEMACSWMIDVLSALAKAHEQAIVHRDVKPQNILLDAAERPLLADFGIAMLAADSEMRRTRTGISMGSMAYMPPEQRLDAAHVNHKADIYAAGATLYRLLTAESSVDLFLAAEDSPRWHGLPQGITPIIQRACAPRSEDRYDSAGDLAQALMDLYPESSADTVATPVERSFPEPSRELPPDSTEGTSKARRRRRTEALSPAVLRMPTRGPADDTGPTLAPKRRPVRWVAAPLALLAVLLVLFMWLQPWQLVGSGSETPGRLAKVETNTPTEPPAREHAPASGDVIPEDHEPAAPKPMAPSTEIPTRKSAPPTRNVTSETVRRSTVAKPPPRPMGPSPLGIWEMNISGVSFRLILSGTHSALRGHIQSSISNKGPILTEIEGIADPNADPNPPILTEVQGVYDPATRSLELDEPSTDGTYAVTLNEDENRGTGRFMGMGRVRNLTIKRVEP